MQTSLTSSAGITAPKTRIFFPNLDGLRFISFFVVFLYHCDLSIFSYLQDSHPKAHAAITFLFRHGNLGVNFFFVLSGFLITYLLIKEKELKGNIHVGNFYVRRILRIWPLYYLCLVIGFVAFPLFKQLTHEPMTETAHLPYYIFFAANFDYLHTWPVKPTALILSVLWSVAVEEQFYLTWPLILRLVPIRKFKFVFPSIILLSLIFRSFYTDSTEADHAVRYFHTFSLIGDMALGGLFAYLCSYENKFKHFIVHLSKGGIILIWVGALLLSLFKHVIFPCGFPIIFERFIIAIFFGLIIVEQNYAKNSFVKMSRFKTITKLGGYTYGLYCLHLLGMYITAKITDKFHLDQTSLLISILTAIAALIFSIGISLLSYHCFEKWFLQIKSRFAVIVSK